VRLEETIAETLYPYGPLIALSNPEDELPPLGAAKTNVDGAAWQPVVEQYMERALQIVMVVGATRNLRWEVDQLLDRRLLPKCVFIFPSCLSQPKRRVASPRPLFARTR
jgi:hypothetical protein